MATIAVWFKHPKTGYVVLVTHEDTRDRCLSEGWTRTPDPNTLPAPVSVSAATPASEPNTAPVTAPADVAPAQGAQPSVAATPSAPSVPTAALADMSMIGDSPEELAQALEDAAVGKVRERNTAARTAFGVETPTPPAASVKPAKPGQKAGGRYAG